MLNIHRIQNEEPPWYVEATGEDRRSIRPEMAKL